MLLTTLFSHDESFARLGNTVSSHENRDVGLVLLSRGALDVRARAKQRKHRHKNNRALIKRSRGGRE